MVVRLRMFFSYAWPAILVFIIDLLSLGWLSRNQDLVLAPVALVVCLLILAAGWSPLVLKPGAQARQAALFATFLAAALLLPPPQKGFQKVLLSPLEDISSLQLWRIANSMTMLPCAFHLSALITKNHRLSRWKILFPLYLSPAVWMGSIFLIRDVQALGWLRELIIAWILGFFLFLIIILFQGARQTDRNDPFIGQQIRALLFVILLVLIPVFLRFFGLILEREIIPYDWLVISLAILPIGVGYVILRHNLFNIDALIRRTAGYAIISALAMLAIFLVAMVTGNRAASRMPEYRWGSVFIALLILAAFFAPVQRWLQNQIDRWFYPERYLFSRQIGLIQQKITRVIRTTEIVSCLEIELPESIGAKWAVWVAGIIPQTPKQAAIDLGWSTLLQVEDKILGGFWLGIRKSGLPYTREETHALALLCQQAALAMAYANTLEDVESINRELERRVEERTAQVLEREQALALVTERRRIARDLHDSISQTLFSINLGARAIRKLAEKDIQSAKDELVLLEKSAQTAQQEMRVLLNELREPFSPDSKQSKEIVLPLKEHFAGLAAQTGEDGHPPLLEVHYQGVGQLWVSHALAEVLYQVCKEALHNVVKHARVREAWCIIEKSKSVIRMIIEDNGVGFSDKMENPNTMGIKNMRQRVAEFQGNLNIENIFGGGSRVTVEIPLEEEA